MLLWNLLFQVYSSGKYYFTDLKEHPHPKFYASISEDHIEKHLQRQSPKSFSLTENKSKILREQGAQSWNWDIRNTALKYQEHKVMLQSIPWKSKRQMLITRLSI